MDTHVYQREMTVIGITVYGKLTRRNTVPRKAIVTECCEVKKPYYLAGNNARAFLCKVA